MSRYRQKDAVPVLCACAVLACGTLATASPPKLPAGEQPKALALQIRALHAEIGVCEPLPMCVTITNRSERPERIDPNQFSQFVFLTSRDGGVFAPCGYGKDFFLHVSGFFEPTPPGGSKSHKEIVFSREFDWDGSKFRRLAEPAFAFTKPGKYLLKARTKELESNVIEIHVRKPTTEESAAAERFTKGGVVRFLQGTWMLPADQRKAVAGLEELLTAGHAAQFNDWAHRRLGDYCLGEWRKDHNDATEEKAYKHFAAVSGRIAPLRLYTACQQLGILGTKPAYASRKEFLELQMVVYSPESQKSELLDPLLLQQAQVAALCLRIMYAEDARLDKKVDGRFGRPATDGEILRRISEQADVPLSVHERAGGVNVMERGQKAGTLRECLRALSDRYLGYWTPVGDGYMRVPVTDVVPIPKQ